MRYGRFKKAVSGFLAAMTIMTTVFSPLSAYAAEVPPEEPKPPLYEEVKNELDADEVVKAKDLELETGSIFEVEKDFTGLEIPDEKKVKITFHEAKNEEKQDFTTDYEDTYKAVYYVEPVSGHPIYQINRKLIVKEAVVQVTESENQESVSNQEDENNNEVYKQRRCIVEHPFGTIKRSLGYSFFLRCRQENVDAEAASMFIAYNFKRLLSMFSTEELVTKFEESVM